LARLLEKLEPLGQAIHLTLLPNLVDGLVADRDPRDVLPGQRAIDAQMSSARPSGSSDSRSARKRSFTSVRSQG
jgi:hypothetical protein